MPHETLIVSRDRGIATVLMNRPQRNNAMNSRMRDELLDAFAEIATNPDDRVVVLTGAGGSFCTGADLGDDELMARGSIPALDLMRLISELCLAVHNLPKVVIAKVSGTAYGFGMNLALGCDLVVADETARFCEVFRTRGLAVDGGGSWLLPRLTGLHRAKELVLVAEEITGAQAAEMGIINRLLPPSELDDFVADWALRLATGSVSALSASKRLLNRGLFTNYQAALEAEAHTQTAALAGPDWAEGSRAFFERRPPAFPHLPAETPPLTPASSAGTTMARTDT